jgi:hypothetical protein
MSMRPGVSADLGSETQLNSCLISALYSRIGRERTQRSGAATKYA